MRILRSRRYSTYFGCETKTDSIFIRPLWRISCQYDTFCDCRRPLVEYVIIYCLGCRPQAEPIHIYWLRLWPIQIDANVNDITQFWLDAALTNIVIVMILIFIYVFNFDYCFETWDRTNSYTEKIEILFFSIYYFTRILLLTTRRNVFPLPVIMSNNTTLKYDFLKSNPFNEIAHLT